MENVHVIEKFPNNWPIWADGPSGVFGVFPGELSAHISSKCVLSP